LSPLSHSASNLGHLNDCLQKQ